jgi:hypothetical protein
MGPEASARARPGRALCFHASFQRETAHRSMADAPPPPVTCTAAEIKRICATVLMEAYGGPADKESVASRAADVEARFPDFARSYPTLVVVCCGSTTSAQQDMSRRMLTLMTDQLARLPLADPAAASAASADPAPAPTTSTAPDGTVVEEPPLPVSPFDAKALRDASAAVGSHIFRAAGVIPGGTPAPTGR